MGAFVRLEAKGAISRRVVVVRGDLIRRLLQARRLYDTMYMSTMRCNIRYSHIINYKMMSIAFGAPLRDINPLGMYIVEIKTKFYAI